jgi:asparagine synthase (glutamine-hydrolysing)
MCGIAGILNTHKAVSEDALRAMCNRMLHRGPDGEGYFLHNNVGLGHRRLSIIDLDGGNQPFANATGTLWISYNGELYNYRELRTELQALGHAFRTQSDTEVVLTAYQHWGKDCLQKFRGMFAFGIADLQKEKLFLARDHFGIKPLIYFQNTESFAFASEIQALRALPSFPTMPSFSAIDQFLGFKYISAPFTAFEGVKKLPPAHYMEVDFSGRAAEPQAYWQLQFLDRPKLSTAEWLEEADAILRDSVKAHLVSDVPFGAFLSGGIDSSLVVGYMAQLMDRPVKTFCIGFEENKYDERAYARQVAAHWKTEHYEEVVSGDALSLLPDLVRHYGEPFGDVSAIPTYYVSKLARKEVTMALSGDAGDELFAGYEAYTDNWARQIKPIPYHLPKFKKWLYPTASKFFPGSFPLRNKVFEDWLKHNGSFYSPLWNKDIRAMLKPDSERLYRRCFERTHGLSHFRKAQYMDFHHYLPHDILVKVDIASMMNTLETRTPLLDIRVVEWASQIPESLNIRQNGPAFEGKRLLKKLLSRHFPPEFVNRPKQGFGVPMESWLPPGHERIRALESADARIARWFDKDKLKEVLQSPRREGVWRLLILEEWLSTM